MVIFNNDRKITSKYLSETISLFFDYYHHQHPIDSMSLTQIPYPQLPKYFSPLVIDYLEQKSAVDSFYHHTPDESGIIKQLKEKAKQYTLAQRQILHQALSEQYPNSPKQSTEQIDSLLNENTFTITTGHQLNIFTGPLYFIYKIISTMVTTRALNRQYPQYHFIPIYWMATEDHDFEEINHFIFQNKKFYWDKDTNKAVGRLDTKGLEQIFSLFEKELGDGINTSRIKELFEEAYLSNHSLAKATFSLVHQLFHKDELLIIDADHPSLKKSFVPYMREDLVTQTCQQQVQQTNAQLEKLGYKIQVNPRECNLFYLSENNRERIVHTDNGYATADNAEQWSAEEIDKELDTHPKRFSPNVLMRPLYQEVILPNLAYIGGAGELSYWLQLKSFFDKSNIPFPVLMPRHAALWMTPKQEEKLKALDIHYEDLFLDHNSFINKIVRKRSNIDIDFSPQKQLLQQQFADLYELAKQTDASFLGAVKAQERKQIKGLEQLEKRLLSAQKRVLSDYIIRATTLKQELFPHHNLQERVINFSEIYTEQGEAFFEKTNQEFKAFAYNFFILQ